MHRRYRRPACVASLAGRSPRVGFSADGPLQFAPSCGALQHRRLPQPPIDGLVPSTQTGLAKRSFVRAIDPRLQAAANISARSFRQQRPLHGQQNRKDLLKLDAGATAHLRPVGKQHRKRCPLVGQRHAYSIVPLLPAKPVHAGYGVPNHRMGTAKNCQRTPLLVAKPGLVAGKPKRAVLAVKPWKIVKSCTPFSRKPQHASTRRLATGFDRDRCCDEFRQIDMAQQDIAPLFGRRGRQALRRVGVRRVIGPPAMAHGRAIETVERSIDLMQKIAIRTQIGRLPLPDPVSESLSAHRRTSRPAVRRIQQPDRNSMPLRPL